MPRVLVVGATDATVAALDERLDVVRVEERGAALARAAETGVDAVVAGTEVDGLPLLRRVGGRAPATPAVLLVDEVDGATLNAARDDGIEVVAAGGGAAERVRRIAADRAAERDRRDWAATRRAVDRAIRAAAAAGSRDAVAERVCAALVEGSGYRIACIADGEGADRSPRAVAGIGADALDLSGFPTPDADAVRTREAEDAAGTRTLASVPLGGTGTLYLVAAGPIGSEERRRLADLGGVVGRVAVPPDADGSGTAPDSVATLGAALAHELGNEVQAATLRIEPLREDDPAEHGAALDDVSRALDRIGRIADLARTLGSGTVADRSVVDVAERARTAWTAVDPGEGAILDAADAPRIRAQGSLLDLLLENLLRNAIEHAGPAVTVTVGPTEDGFVVADDGPGFPDGDRDRLPDWGTTAGDGSGLGLAIVRRIADAHGWSVALDESAAGGARIAVHGATRVG
ncbi:MAG: ATP-binding protein [Haloferacaceae archaeon]